MFVIYIISGLVGGILGGMGMGGGTILIPILTLLLNVPQKTAQAINLISFIPMAIVSLVIHIKNKRVVFDNLFYSSIFGIIFCVIGFFVSKEVPSNILRIFFGVFLILLAIFGVYSIIKSKKSWWVFVSKYQANN